MHYTATAVILLTLMRLAGTTGWRAEVSHCETTRGRLIARYFQCERDPVSAPCGQIQAVRQDLGALAYLKVRWQSGKEAEVLIGPYQKQVCILGSRFLSRTSVASTQ